jgi:hypothetical protein
MLNLKHTKGRKGQAVVEMAFAMPFLIWLVYYTLNAFYTIHTSHVAQKYSVMNLYQRINNRSKIIVDDVAGRPFSKEFMAVQYLDPSSNRQPQRKIISTPRPVNNIVGICREPGCQ